MSIVGPLGGRAAGIALAVAIGLLAAVTGFGLDVSDGRVRLSLIEGTGRFAIYGQTSGEEGIFLSLLSEKDPRTTTLSIMAGDKVYRMGERTEFSEKAEVVPGGARFVWTAAFLRVVEAFTFLAARNDGASTGTRRRYHGSIGLLKRSSCSRARSPTFHFPNPQPGVMGL